MQECFSVGDEVLMVGLGNRIYVISQVNRFKRLARLGYYCDECSSESFVPLFYTWASFNILRRRVRYEGFM